MNHAQTSQSLLPDLFPIKLNNEIRHPLMEPALFYDPPYAEPTEDDLAWHLVKYLRPDASLRYNVRIAAPSITFELDFMIEVGDFRVGIICGLDSRQHHEHQENLHYALMLDGGFVDVVYRFREEDLKERLHDTLYVMACWNPGLFSERGRINLTTLATPEARTFQPVYGHTLARILYARPELDEAEWEAPAAWPAHAWRHEELVVRRLSRAEPAAWILDYNRALAFYDIPSDWLGQRLARTA